MSELVKSLATVAKSLGSWSTDKTNKDQNYSYISADQVLDRVGQALASAGIVIIPAISEERVIEATYTNKYGDKTRYDAVVGIEMTITDGNDSLVLQWVGRGSDYAVPDKATYKAITSGHKYFLMKLFNIGVGNEDGEHESPDSSGPSQQRRPPAPQPNGNGKKDNPAKRVTIPMLKELHIKGKAAHGDDKWESICTDINAGLGVDTSKAWPWETYWEVMNGLDAQPEQPAPAEDDTFGL